MAHRRIPLTLDPPGRTTPAQIVALVLAVAVAFVLVPVGARAAGQLVTLVDSTSSRQARVDATSSLTVSSRPVGSTPWFFETDIGATGNLALFVPPVGKTKLALSSLTVANGSGSAAETGLTLLGSTDCSSNILAFLERTIVRSNDTVTMSFPEPLLIAPGGSDWCLSINISNALVNATATGYYF